MDGPATRAGMGVGGYGQLGDGRRRARCGRAKAVGGPTRGLAVEQFVPERIELLAIHRRLSLWSAPHRHGTRPGSLRPGRRASTADALAGEMVGELGPGAMEPGLDR